jgi:hypothetical protein
MKLTTLILLWSISPVLAGDVQLHIVQHREPVTAEDAGKFTSNVIVFVESASVDATSAGGGSNMWQAVLESSSYIHLSFTPPRTFRLPVMGQSGQRWEDRPVTEILVSLPEGRYPGIQLRAGTDYMAVTKYDPRALKRVVMEPALQLSTVAPYDSFYRLKEATLVYRIDKSELDSEVWRKATATAKNHIATGKSQMGGAGGYTLMRVVLKNPDPKERIEVHAVKLKDLKPEYYGGGEALRFVSDGEFVFFEHIDGASRRNNQDPLLLKSTVRGSNTIWVDVPKQWELQVLGDIIVEHH